jgi:hypothetical protein
MLGWDLRRGRFIDCESLLSILGVPGLIAVASPLPATIPAAQPPEQDDTRNCCYTHWGIEQSSDGYR